MVGYARALEVVAREWRVGEGPAGAMPADAGTAAQRELFAAVRENRYALDADGAPAPGPRAAGRSGRDRDRPLPPGAVEDASAGRSPPDAVYAPFVKDRVPEGISPAAVLGPFRNFQAKLLSAWAPRGAGGQAAADIADLVDAYARALPAERAEVIRIFVVTTFGATVQSRAACARRRATPARRCRS